VEHEDEVSDALKAALRIGKPAVVEIMLTQELTEPLRRDAFKPPRRLLPKYKKFSAKQYK
jgi:sulfoacetaldehyde acetyltransferase